MYQVGVSINHSRVQYSNYQTLKSLSTVKFYRTIASYLTSGDASLLGLAQQQLTEMVDSADLIQSLTLAKNIGSAANNLSIEIDTKYRAMGKLSGDPLVLLTNAEQSMSAIVKSLAKYAEQSLALTAVQKTRYLVQTNLLAASLSDIVYAREKILSGKSTGRNSIKDTLVNLQNLSDTLNNMPLLEILADANNEEDDFFDEVDVSEDLSEEALNELNSLINRYQAELSRTVVLFDQKKQGLALLSEQVADLEQIILSGEQEIKQQQQEFNQQLLWVVIGLLIFLIFFLSANYWLMRSVILKPLRKLRDSFVQLVQDGKVENITGIVEHTELGEISHSFNKLVNNIAQKDKDKAAQLNLVSNAMKTMENQAKNILDSSSSTHQHLNVADNIMKALTDVTDNVNSLSHKVVDNAKLTQQAMNHSQDKVNEVLNASEITNRAANEGKEAIVSLTQSVESVGSIVDVMSAIADQTNLLALNAAIEAARAGEHGRGFSVVADEVRQLAGKTQQSLGQVSQRLNQLNQASQLLTENIFGIETASAEQQTIAEVLKENAKNVVNKAITSANVAEDTLGQINQQRDHFAEFANAMQSVNNEVSQSRKLAKNISQDVSDQMKDIHQTLNVVS
jgi:methyl-accepting chemotaxis protein